MMRMFVLESGKLGVDFCLLLISHI